MLSFISVFAVSIGALVAVRSLDIECANPPHHAEPSAHRFNEMFALNGPTGTR